MKKLSSVLLTVMFAWLSANAQSANGFSYYKTITIDHTKVSGSNNLIDFPVLISVTDNALRTTANGGRLQNANGWDILFTNSTGSTDLNFQIESYNASNGNLVAWVKIPILSYNSNTEIRIYYGKSGVVSNPSSSSTWTSDYRAVYHFNNSINDATSNNNNGTNHSSTNISSAKIGQGRGFNGTQYITVPNSSSLNITGNTITISAWANITDVPEDAPFVVKGTSINQERYMLGVNNDGGAKTYNMRTTTNAAHHRYNVTNVGFNQWAYVVMVYDGTLGANPRMRMYVNGVLTSSQNASGNILSNTGNLHIGKRPLSDNRYLRGNLDELRISTAVKSTDWIATEYNNQNSPSTFYSISTEMTVCTVSVVINNHVTCFGGNNGSLTANVTGGTPPYTYAWSGGGNNATKNNVTAGTYTVTVTDAVGTTTTVEATVEQPAAALTGSIIVNQHETCNGCGNGSITASATGGEAPYEYDWGGGNNNASRTNLSAGNYTVTITDNVGCTTTAGTTVNVAEGNNALAGYEFRKAITIDNTKVCGSTPHNNFPILINVTDSDLRTLANGGKVLNANGYDIVFTDSDGNTLLDHQIEKYTASSGLFVAWVKIPSLPHNSNKVIYMYFGKTGVTTNPSNNNVWDSGYKAVWHFNNSINDYSGNSNNGTNSGSTNNNSGKIAEARSFNGSNQFITVANSSSLNITGNAITMSAWVKVPQNAQDAPFVVKGTTMNEEQYMMGIQNGSNRFLNRRITTSGGHFRYDANTLPNDTWAYVVTVYDGAKASNPRLFTYINGSLVASENANGTINSNSGQLHIGKRLGSDNRYLQGSIDELRLSNIVRSADWICTEYNNQNSPSTFYSIGSLESLVPAGTIIWRGTIDKHWSKAGNWSTNAVPTETDSVYVPYGTTNTLELNGSGNYSVKHIYFDNMATLSSAPAATLNIKGNLHVGGCGFNVNNGLIKFNGNIAQYIYTPCRLQFRRLHIENTSSTGVYMVGASVQVNHELYLTDGYLYTNGDTVVVARNSANNAIKEYNEDESHVVGYLTRFINKNKDTYAFPVGKGAADDSYLISIKNNNMEGISRLTAIFRDLDEDPQVINNMLANANIEEDGVVYRRLCEEGMWTIEPNIQPIGGSYSVIADLKNFRSVTSTEVGILKKPSGAPATNWGLGNGQRNNNIVGNLGMSISQIMRNSKAERGGLTSFSDFGVGDEGGGSGLPIELLSFTGEMNAKSNAVDLFWTTATEINNEKFLVQRSLDGENFEDLGEVAGAGNSNTALSYQFSDTKPVKGIAYYRLKQIDFDGKYAYSDLISITNSLASITKSDVEVKVYPNPTDGLMNILAPTDEKEIHVHIIDMNGTIIKALTVNNETESLKLSIDLREHLVTGNYFIKVSGQNFANYKKIQVYKN